MTSDIDKTILRTRQYWYEDGLTELATAIVFALVAAVFALEAIAPEGSILAVSSAFLLPAAVMGGIFVTRRLVTRAKERITYPRSGYVVYRHPSRRLRSVAAVVAAAIGVGIALLVVGGGVRELGAQYIPLFTAVVIGGFMLFLGATVGLARFYVLAVASVVIGALAARALPDPTDSSAVYFAAMAVAMATSGAVTLRRYMRANEPLADSAVAAEAK